MPGAVSLSLTLNAISSVQREAPCVSLSLKLEGRPARYTRNTQEARPAAKVNPNPKRFNVDIQAGKEREQRQLLASVGR